MGDVYTIIEDGEEYLVFDNEAIATSKYLEFNGEEKLFKAQIKPTDIDCELESP